MFGVARVYFYVCDKISNVQNPIRFISFGIAASWVTRQQCDDVQHFASVFAFQQFPAAKKKHLAFRKWTCQVDSSWAAK